jgi:hypothetical protein
MTEQPATDEGGTGQRQPELDHQPAPFGAPAELAVLVAPGVGVLDRPAATRLEAYKFFFPTVSGPAIFKGTAAAGLTSNQVYGTMDTRPEQVGFTLNSDTPHGPMLLDLRDGPMVIELPPGPLMCAVVRDA